MQKALKLIDVYFKDFIDIDYYYENFNKFYLLLDRIFQNQVGNSIIFDHVCTFYNKSLLSIANTYINSIGIKVAYLKNQDLEGIIVGEEESFERAEAKAEVFSIWKSDFMEYHKLD